MWGMSIAQKYLQYMYRGDQLSFMLGEEEETKDSNIIRSFLEDKCFRIKLSTQASKEEGQQKRLALKPNAVFLTLEDLRVCFEL